MIETQDDYEKQIEEEDLQREKRLSLLNNSLIKRCVSDHGLPITVFEDPIFSHQLRLYMPVFRVDIPLLSMVDSIEALGSADAFFQMEAELRERIITDIKNTDGYKRFISEDFNKIVGEINFSSVDRLYTPDNVGKRFVSFDMKKANFQSLYSFDPSIFNGCKNWADFLYKYTQNIYFFGAKRFRQIIFGNLNPKRQQTCQKGMISQIIQFANSINLGPLVFASADECVFELDYSQETFQYKIDTVVDEGQKRNIDVRAEVFTLQKLQPHPFYVKIKETKNVSDRLDIKCVPAVLYAQAFRRAYQLYDPHNPLVNHEIVHEDLAFYFENQLAFFAKPLEFED